MYRQSRKLFGVIPRPTETQRLNHFVALPRRTFSSRNSDGNGTKGVKPSPVEQHALYLEQLNELNEERERIFQFTEDEKSAWGNTNATKHRFDQNFLNTLEEERNQYFTDYQSLDDVETSLDIDFEKSNDAQQMVHQPRLSHVTSDGSSVNMVDVTKKEVTTRVAVAQTIIRLPQEVVSVLLNSYTPPNQSSLLNELVSPTKGPIFTTAKIAGIMAAKKTSDIIPLCHPLALNQVSIDITFDQSLGLITIECTCVVNGKTGVEMEALVGSSVAALTIYDMTKAISHDITICETKLLQKSGGKRTFHREETS